jgi:hypothetical protein
MDLNSKMVKIKIKPEVGLITIFKLLKTRKNEDVTQIRFS